MFEISVQYTIKEHEAFTMNPGYLNFQLVGKNEVLAHNQSGRIRSPMRGRIFMPLYQDQGSDGYFIIRKIPAFALRLSALLRKWQSDRVLVWLPGIAWHDEARRVLKVNIGVARFLTKQIFHLLGYRSRRRDEKSITMRQREYNARTEDYRLTPWNT